nr:uncharacterized protein LOC129283665 [Lytechinus pictus]
MLHRMGSFQTPLVVDVPNPLHRFTAEDSGDRVHDNQYPDITTKRTTGFKSGLKKTELCRLVAVSRKRKTPCDADEVNQTTPPTKKLGVVSSKFSVDFLAKAVDRRQSQRPFHRTHIFNVTGVTQLHCTTSRDSTKGATSPLMSVDFSLSSRSLLL